MSKIHDNRSVWKVSEIVLASDDKDLIRVCKHIVWELNNSETSHATMASPSGRGHCKQILGVSYQLIYSLIKGKITYISRHSMKNLLLALGVRYKDTLTGITILWD